MVAWLRRKLKPAWHQHPTLVEGAWALVYIVIVVAVCGVAIRHLRWVP